MCIRDRFLTYPLGLGVWLGFTDAKIGRAGSFVGLENYLFPVSYTHLRAHETVLDLVCRLLLAQNKHDK